MADEFLKSFVGELEVKTNAIENNTMGSFTGKKQTYNSMRLMSVIPV